MTVTKTVNGNQQTDTTKYLLEGQNVIQEKLNGAISATYLIGPRGVEYKQDNNGVRKWFVYDGLGSVLAEISEPDSNGNISVYATPRTDVYGCQFGTAETEGSKHRFVGKLGHTMDYDSGLIYMRARYYDPATGRFISEDPARDGDNWYAYCNNNPVNMIDQDGKIAILVVVGVILAVAAAAYLVYKVCKWALGWYNWGKSFQNNINKTRELQKQEPDDTAWRVNQLFADPEFKSFVEDSYGKAIGSYTGSSPMDGPKTGVR